MLENALTHAYAGNVVELMIARRLVPGVLDVLAREGCYNRFLKRTFDLLCLLLCCRDRLLLLATLLLVSPACVRDERVIISI